MKATWTVLCCVLGTTLFTLNLSANNNEKETKSEESTATVKSIRKTSQYVPFRTTTIGVYVRKRVTVTPATTTSTSGTSGEYVRKRVNATPEGLGTGMNGISSYRRKSTTYYNTKKGDSKKTASTDTKLIYSVSEK